jgi:hypothetical protein
MRSSIHHDPERGLLAAIKVVAIVAAVGMLAMVAGKSSYTPAGAVVTPAYVVAKPPRDPAPRVARDMPSHVGATALPQGPSVAKF